MPKFFTAAVSAVSLGIIPDPLAKKPASVALGGGPLPVSPSAGDASVQAKLDEERRQRGGLGRASTLLSDPALGVGLDLADTATANMNKRLLLAGTS